MKYSTQFIAFCICTIVICASFKDSNSKDHNKNDNSKWTMSRGIIAKPNSVPTAIPTIQSSFKSDADLSLVSNSLTSDSSHNSDEVQNDEFDDFEEVDDSLIFVVTVDGRYHMINRNSLQWSSETSDPTVYSYDNMLGSPARDNEYKRVIPDTDGMLLMYTEDGMRKTNMKASTLADSAPFISDDGIIFTSEKSSRVIQVDMANGNIRDLSRPRPNRFPQQANPQGMPTITVSSGENRCEIPFYLARVDYAVSGVDMTTGDVFQMSYSDIEPLQKTHASSNSRDRDRNRNKLAASSDNRLTGGSALVGNNMDVDYIDLDALDDLMEPHVEEDLHPELQSSPNGEMYFADGDGRHLSHLPTLNLGSLVKSAYVIENSGVGRAVDPDDVRPATPSYIRKLNVVRRMNRVSATISENDRDIAIDVVKRSEGTVLVQSIHNGEGGVSGVFAIEIPPACSALEECIEDAFADSAALNEKRKDEVLYLCPSGKHGVDCSLDDEVAEVGEDGSEEDSELDRDELDEEEMLRTIAAQPLSTLQSRTPPKGVTLTLSPGTKLQSANSSGAGKVVTGKILSPGNQSEVDGIVVDVIPQSTRTKGPCKRYCESPAENVLDLFGTSAAEDIIDLDSCCDSVAETTFSAPSVQSDQPTAVRTSEEPSDPASGVPKAVNDIRGEHKLLRDAHEGNIFGLAADKTRPEADNEKQKSQPSALANRVNHIPSIIQSILVFLSENNWLITLLLIVVVSVLAVIGPNNLEGARWIDYFFGTKLSADLQLGGAETPLGRHGLVTPQISQMRRLQGDTSSKIVSPDVVLHLPASHVQTRVDAVVPADNQTSFKALQKAESQEFDELGRRVTKIGSLRVFSEAVLGYGSHGTVVFEGKLNERPVAIKRMLTQFHKSADREISLLIRSDGHPNVVRYFLKEQKADFLYLALQLCQMSLRDFVTRLKTHQTSGDSQRGSESSAPTDNVGTSDALRRSLLQIAQGITHLHSHRIVHRDIKPHNILCALVTEADHSSNEAAYSGAIQSLDQLGEYVLKISDMGLSKQLDRHETSFSSMSFSMSMSIQAHRAAADTDAAPQPNDDHLHSPVGTIGWQAPELLGGRRCAPTKGAADTPSGSITASDAPQLSRQVSEDGLEEVDEKEEDEGNVTDNENENETEDVPGKLTCDQDAEVAQHSESIGSVKSSTSSARPSLTATTVLSSRQNRKRTQTVDIFSLGCVFYYVLSVGEHPFGEWYERESNIVSNNLALPALENQPDAADLIQWMLNPDPLRRPTGSEVCSHPFFWSSNKRLEFLVEFSDRLEQEPATAAVVLAVESNASTIVGTRWDSKLDGALLEDMGKYRKYDANSVRDLLRVVRNKRHHYHELSTGIKKLVGPLPMGFYAYFDKRFPRLLLHCVKVAEKFLAADRLFAQWFQKPKRITRAASSTNLAVTDTSIAAVTIKVNDPSAATTVEVVENVEKTLVAQTDEVTAQVQVSAAMSFAAPLDVGADVIIWQGSVLETSLQCHGWWRSSSSWVEGGASAMSGGSKKARPNHVTKALQDPKYRTSLCSHWEETAGAGCPMRKKGKCIFAHGPTELRVREGKRRWGKNNSTVSMSAADLLRMSGGEDVFGAAKGMDKSKQRPTGSDSAPSSVSGFGGSVNAAVKDTASPSHKSQQAYVTPSAPRTLSIPTGDYSPHTPLPPQYTPPSRQQPVPPPGYFPQRMDQSPGHYAPPNSGYPPQMIPGQYAFRQQQQHIPPQFNNHQQQQHQHQHHQQQSFQAAQNLSRSPYAQQHPQHFQQHAGQNVHLQQQDMHHFGQYSLEEELYQDQQFQEQQQQYFNRKQFGNYK